MVVLVELSCYISDILCPAVGITLLAVLGRLICRSCFELLKGVVTGFSNLPSNHTVRL